MNPNIIPPVNFDLEILRRAVAHARYALENGETGEAAAAIRAAETVAERLAAVHAQATAGGQARPTLAIAFSPN